MPHHRHYHVELKGKDEHGRWKKTAPAKTYPPRMCALLAEAFVKNCRVAIGASVGAQREPLPDDIAQLCIPIDWYNPASWTAYASW